MVSQSLTFQLGTHYLSRTALRIERLFSRIGQAVDQELTVIHDAALNDLAELLKITEKPELKGRFLQEYMRIEHALQHTDVDVDPAMMSLVSEQVKKLSEFAGPFGGSIHSDTFLHAITTASHGRAAEVDLYMSPLLYWLEGPTAERQADLKRWLMQFIPLPDIIAVYLSLLRKKARFDGIQSENGYYQCMLPNQHKKTSQLVLVKIDKAQQLIPKIHVGQHGLSIRLCEAKTMKEVKEASTPMQLSICEL